MLKAYLDESNSNLQGKVCVVAGYVGTTRQWESFEKEWYPALHPKQKLHMTDLRWTDADRKMLGKIGILPDQHGLRRIISTFPNDAYKKFIKGKIRDKYANPYMMGVQLCVAQLLRSIAENKEKIAIYFEEQSVYRHRVADMSETILRFHGDERIISVTTLRKDFCFAFQIADYLSYAVGQLEEKPKGRRTRWCLPILGDGSHIGLEANEEFAKIFVSKCTALGLGVDDDS